MSNPEPLDGLASVRRAGLIGLAAVLIAIDLSFGTISVQAVETSRALNDAQRAQTDAREARTTSESLRVENQKLIDQIDLLKKNPPGKGPSDSQLKDLQARVVSL